MPCSPFCAFFNRLLGRDLRNRFFQHTICLFPGLHLESTDSTALCARSERMPSMGPALKTDGRGAGILWALWFRLRTLDPRRGSFPSLFTRTCCGMPAATSWPMMAMTLVQFATTWAIETLNTLRYAQLTAQRFNDFWKE